MTFKNTFVSSFIDLNPIENRPSDKNLFFYLDKATRLLSTRNLPFVVFVDSKTKNIFENEYKIHSLNPNIRIVETSVNDFQISKVLDPNTAYVPNKNNPLKDTYYYMATMINKTDYVKRAIELNPFESERFTWIDLGILHIIKDNEVECFEETLEYIETFDEGIITQEDDDRNNKIRIPGCFFPTGYILRSSLRELSEKPCWVFCGGFFSGRIKAQLKFDEEVKKCFEILKKDNFITWEINIWVYILCNTNPNLFDFYLADHNIRMIRDFRVTNTK